MTNGWHLVGFFVDAVVSVTAFEGEYVDALNRPEKIRAGGGGVVSIVVVDNGGVAWYSTENKIAEGNSKSRRRR